MKKEVSDKKRIKDELSSFLMKLNEVKSPEEKKMIEKHINLLKERLKEEGVRYFKPLKSIKAEEPIIRISDDKKERVEDGKGGKERWVGKRPQGVERETLERLKKREERVEAKELKKPSSYVKISNKFFSDVSHSLAKKDFFKHLKRDLVKANLQFVPASYISTILFTTVLSFIAGVLVFIFLLFFNISSQLPLIFPVKESLSLRILKTFWIMFAFPIVTSIFMYFYPSMEKSSIEGKINQELPFATIHMAAVSGSMIDPTNIFRIIISTGEYEYLGREFTKLINEVNVYGYDLVSALRRSAFNSPSRKLSELFNGLATTITSGGNLPGFFDKRAQSLLFEYRLEREKYTRTAETFMDIYISVVIAAPMIFMLLLMIIKISGLGLSLSIGTIVFLMILGVSTINIVFLVFLQLKQPNG